MTVIAAIDLGNRGRPDTEGNWVSGDVANLGISTNVTVVFDLGPAWRSQRSVIVAGVGLADSTSGTITADFSADAAGSVRKHPAMTPNALSGKFSYLSALSAFVCQLIATDRYLRVNVNNGSSAAQPAGASLRVVSHDL